MKKGKENRRPVGRRESKETVYHMCLPGEEVVFRKNNSR